MHTSRLVRLVRLVGFGLVLAVEVYLVVRLGADFSPANHFSYFTILSNVIAAIVLLVGAFRPVPDGFRGAAVLYMVTTGIVYAVLLRGVDVQTPDLANHTLHIVMPILVVVDWLLDPPQRPIAFRRALWWLAFPLAYLGYTLLRGPIVDWYPYPFVDPRTNGYGSVLLTSLVIAVFVGLLAWLIAWVGDRLRVRTGSD